MMRDIISPRDAEPRPDRPPRPAAERQPRRKLRAALLGAFLVLALLIAGVGSIVGAFTKASNIPSISLPFASVFDTISDTYHRLMGLAGSGVALVQLGRDALALAPDVLQGKRGDEFIELLGRAEREFTSLGNTSLIPQLGAKGSDLGTATGAFRSWLTSAPERHIAVVFDNSSEMRAGGGFIGSYAEVTMRGGAVSGITVHDINDADANSGDRTIPPVPLEPVANRWRAADANWFLSGPASGQAFLTLLNRSPLYKDKPMDAVVFVQPRVVSELLAITGPISAGGVAVDSTNFLQVIQDEVQQGQATGAASPKAVLTKLVPAFMQALLGQANKQPLAILDAIRGGMQRKDIIAFASDPAAERGLETLGISGSLYPTDDRFMGGYVAVAPSTIGGDKTDAVTSESISVREQLLPRGLVETTVDVDRSHKGKATDPWWYQEDNRSYVKVYAPQNSSPTGVAGIWLRERSAATYDSTYATYEPLQSIVATERTYPDVPGVDATDEGDKTVFGFWQRTPRGQGTVAHLTYATQLQRVLNDGDTYTLVIERQPGSTAHYEAEVYAPPGFQFVETGTARFTWSSDDPQGQTVLTLTLQAAN